MASKLGSTESFYFTDHLLKQTLFQLQIVIFFPNFAEFKSD